MSARTRLTIAFVVTSAILAAACGSDGGAIEPTGGAGPDTTVVTTVPSGDADDTADAGGSTAPTGEAGEQLRHPDYTYQDDVVFVGDAGEAVLGATADGITWTIDGDAAGAGDVEIGAVMYASHQAVGRVAAVDPVGDDLAVMLAPVQITEVLRDAVIDIDTEIPVGDLEYQEIPEYPGAVADPSDDTGTVEVAEDAPVPEGPPTGQPTDGTESVGKLHGRSRPDVGADVETVRLAPINITNRRQGDRKRLPPKSKNGLKVTAGDWEVEPYNTDSALGLKIGYKANANIKVFADLALKRKNLRIRSNMKISGGSVDAGGTFVIDGLEAIALDLQAGAAQAGSANKKFRVEVPVDIVMQIPGEPLVYSNKWTFSVTTAFGGNNATIVGNGEWALSGSLGVLNGEIVAPSLTTTKSIIDSITGLSLGATGIVFAAETKYQFGIGIPAAFAGPYSKLVVDFGLTNGSSLGAPLARCVGASLDLWVGGGMGLTLSASVFDALKKVLPKNAKIDLSLEKVKNVFHRSQILPDVPLCTAAA